MKTPLLILINILCIQTFAQTRSIASDTDATAKLDKIRNCIISKEIDCNKQISLAIAELKTKEDSIYLSFLNELATVIQTKQNLDSSVKYHELYVNEAKRLNNKKHVVLSLDNLGSAYVFLSRYADAKRIIEEGVEIAENEGLESLKVQLLVHLGSAFRNAGQLVEAQEYTLIALASAKEHQLKKGEAQALITLGTIFGMNRKFHKSRNYSLEAARVFNELDDSLRFCKAYINAANASMSLSMFDTAEVLLSEAISLLSNESHPYILAGALVQQGRSRYFAENYVEAIHALEEAHTLAAANGNKKQVAFVESILAETYLKVGQYKQGLDHASKAYGYYSSIAKSDETSSIAQTLSKAYELNGDFENSLTFHKIYVKLKDSLIGARSAKELADLELEYETSIKQKKITSLEQEKILITQRNTGLFGILGLIIAGGLFFINRQRKTIKSNKIISEQKSELRKRELEKEKITRDKLEIELNQSKRELASNALRIAKGNELLTELENVIKKEADPEKTLVKLQRTLNNSKNHEKDWDKFLTAFESVHPNYIKKLKNINPKLTANDIRLCSLERMNFDRNQIASILHISAEGVKKARYRLKNKLRLDSEVSVVSFLKTL